MGFHELLKAQAPLLLPLRARTVDHHNALGYAARQRGDLRVAAEEYGAAIAADPSHFKSHFNRGFTYDKVRVRDLYWITGLHQLDRITMLEF